MSLLLIDDRGELWPGDSRQLRTAFDSPFSGGEFVEYAVKNLGFVAINIYGKSIQLRLRPGFVTSRALSGLLGWLKVSKFDRVVLSLFQNSWQDQLLQPPQLRAIVDELAQSSGNARPDDCLTKDLPAAVLEAQPLVGEIYDNWANLAENYDTDTLVRLLRSVFKDRYAIVKKDRNKNSLTFYEFGDKMFPMYDLWRTCAIGAPVHEQPDRAYGRWVAAIYRDASECSKPHLAAVDAIMHCPLKGRSRTRYQRLIFPLQPNSADQLLVGGSFDDPTIDLRVPLG